MPRGVLGALAVLAAAVALAANAEPPEAPKPASVPERFRPIVVSPDDASASKSAKPAKPLDPVRVDKKTCAVRLPVRFSRTSGVVEWLLSAGTKHRGMSVLVTDHSVKAIAEAFAQAGFSPGTPPRPADKDRVLPPKGLTVELGVVVKRGDESQVRYPASLFLSAKSGGKPIEDGKWVYVGPQMVREGEAEILVTALSGSIVTTNLRDTSAIIHWLPKAQEGQRRFVQTFCVSGMPLPPEEYACELEIRPAAREKKPHSKQPARAPVPAP